MRCQNCIFEMGKVTLEIKFTFENVSEITRIPEANWNFDAQCMNCRERFSINFSAQDEFEIPSSRGTANLVQKCKFCSRIFTVNILSKLNLDSFIYTDQDNDSFKPLCDFETRGVELLSYSFCAQEDEYILTSGSVSKFTLNLSEGEFYDVNEEGQQVCIEQVAHHMK